MAGMAVMERFKLAETASDQQVRSFAGICLQDKNQVGFKQNPFKKNKIVVGNLRKML